MWLEKVLTESGVIPFAARRNALDIINRIIQYKFC